MRIGMLTREWPPAVYGGAGVHVEYLVRELRRLAEVDVHAFPADGALYGAAAASAPSARGALTHRPDPELSGANAALAVLSVDLRMAAATAGCDLVHAHTWYADMAARWAALLHGIPSVLTMHSLEPRRPWKAEQLGGGYRLSSWGEREAAVAADAVIAVSAGMRRDVLADYPDLDPARVHVIHNGVDTVEYAPVLADDVLGTHGIDPSVPYALFVGRITRQKGLSHLLAAAADLPGQLVLCAGAPDTAEIGAEIAAQVAALQARRPGVIWIRDMLPRPQLVQLLSHASVFVCPSIYEPLGIVNLEAMACATAVVASAVGGIPEVVDDGRTGLLVPYDESDPAAFEAALAATIAAVLTDPVRAGELGAAGRVRAVAEFGWPAIATQTLDLYATLLR